MSGSLASPWATSMRNPSTPRSSQKRRIESNSARTSSFVQSRSGCSGAKRCRYHWPGRPSASVTRVHAGPPNTLCQSLGGVSPPGPRPSRKMYRARSALPGGAASAARNHGCSLEVWLGTRSTITRSPSPWASATRASKSASVPKCGVDVAVVGHVVAGVGLGRRVERVQPDGVDAEVGDVGQPRPDAGQIADAVTVGVGEAADVDLIDDGVAPPGRVRGAGVGHLSNPATADLV